MESPAHSPVPAWSRRVHALRKMLPPRALTLAPVATLLLAGCGDRVVPVPSSPALVTGRRAVPIPPAQLAAATTTIRSFSRTLVPTIYQRRPPRIPDTTPSVRRAQLLGAGRVPAGRRGLRPRLEGVELKIVSRSQLEAEIRVSDGRSPTFSIGATIERGAAGWQVVSLSMPG